MSRYSDTLGPNFASAIPQMTLGEVADHFECHWLQCIPVGDETVPVVIVLTTGDRLEAELDRDPAERCVPVEAIEALDFVERVEVGS